MPVCIIIEACVYLEVRCAARHRMDCLAVSMRSFMLISYRGRSFGACWVAYKASRKTRKVPSCTLHTRGPLANCNVKGSQVCLGVHTL